MTTIPAGQGPHFAFKDIKIANSVLTAHIYGKASQAIRGALAGRLLDPVTLGILSALSTKVNAPASPSSRRDSGFSWTSLLIRIKPTTQKGMATTNQTMHHIGSRNPSMMCMFEGLANAARTPSRVSASVTGTATNTTTASRIKKSLRDRYPIALNLVIDCLREIDRSRLVQRAPHPTSPAQWAYQLSATGNVIVDQLTK